MTDTRPEPVTGHGEPRLPGDCRCGCGHNGLCHQGRGCVCGRGEIAIGSEPTGHGEGSGMRLEDLAEAMAEQAEKYRTSTPLAPGERVWGMSDDEVLGRMAGWSVLDDPPREGFTRRELACICRGYLHAERTQLGNASGFIAMCARSLRSLATPGTLDGGTDPIKWALMRILYAHESDFADDHDAAIAHGHDVLNACVPHFTPPSEPTAPGTEERHG